MRGWLVGLVFLSLSAAGSAQAPPDTGSAVAPAPVTSGEGIRRQHRRVSTQSDVAQAAFDDGLTLLYAFNPEEARRSFRRALVADPKLAVAWWGVASSYGDNLNTDYDAGDAKLGHDAIQNGLALRDGATPQERALIDAADRRFSLYGADDGDHEAQAYRNALRAAADRFPDDDDLQALAAEADLNTQPWAFVTPDGSPSADTRDAIVRLKLVLARDHAHIGAEHFIIHALEETAQHDDALPAAKELASYTFEPAAEHLYHMPAHTFERAGLYHEAGVVNERAIAAYTQYLAGDPAGHEHYFGHDCKFGVLAFMTAGESARATSLAATCAAHTGDFGPQVALRFHEWGMLGNARDDYALGLVALHDGNVDAARKHAQNLHGGKTDVAKIEGYLIDAGVARANHDSDQEIAALKHAVAVQDAEGYSEPPAFWFPIRQSLGAAYLRAGRLDDAAATFRADLDGLPNDPRALFGLQQTLERQGDADAAKDAASKFEAAWKYADVPLTMDDL